MTVGTYGMRFFDTHTHLQFKDYDNDREEVLSRARAAGVERMLVVGTDLETSRQALELVGSQNDLVASVGWHPHDAQDWSESAWKELSRLGREPKVVAVGEVGLDYFRNLSPPDRQREVFRKAIHLARDLGKPLIVHSREAHADVLAHLREEGGKEVRGVMHCFSGDQAVAEAALDLGFYISFAAVITYPKNDSLRSIAAKVPKDRILVETDSPFLPPQDRRGKRNEPLAVCQVAETVAQARGMNYALLTEQIWENGTRLFEL